jgi:hypothetical protein
MPSEILNLSDLAAYNVSQPIGMGFAYIEPLAHTNR